METNIQDEPEIFDDMYVGERAPEEAPQKPELLELTADDPEEDSWLDMLNRHVIVAATVGGTALAALGFASGGTLAHRRHLRTA